MSGFLTAALNLAKAGFSVFPLKPKTKDRPAIKEWPQKATTDLAQIRQWWGLSSKNIGIACQDKFIILDVDNKSGKNGFPALKELIKQGLPKTFTVQTPSNGIHLYFKHPGEFIKSTVNHWDGIDIRGNGGYGAAPGSVTPNGEYKLIHAVPPVELPKQFQLPTKEYKKPAADDSTSSLILDSVSQYSEIPPIVKFGERDDFLFKSACSWRERGYARNHAEILMRELHSKCEQKPGDEYLLEDALKKLDQAWTNYKPSDQGWTQVITPQGPIAAPNVEIKSLQEALDRFVFIIAGNRVADLNRLSHVSIMKKEEFDNAFGNVFVSKTKLPTKWLSNRSRQTVRDTIYMPVEDKIIQNNGEQYYNIYSGSNQSLPNRVDHAKIKPFINHVEYIMGSRESAERFIRWCAYSVQNPQQRIPWMPLIITTPRCGKGMIFETMQKVVGVHNTSKIPPGEMEEFAKGFNSWLSGTLLVCIEEIKTTRRWEITEKLKDITTEKYLLINHKHGKKEMEQIFCNLIAFSNHADAVALDKTDGRFWVVCNFCQRKDRQYYKEFSAWMESDGPAHLERFLKTLNNESFDWAEPPPMTEGKIAMIRESISFIEQKILDAIEDREGPFRADIIDSTLVDQFIQADSQQILGSKEKYQIRKLTNENTKSLSQDRYRVQLVPNGPGKRYRCRCLRNFEKWSKATPEEIATEYKRAWMYANGHNPKPDLKEVDNNV